MIPQPNSQEVWPPCLPGTLCGHAAVCVLEVPLRGAKKEPIILISKNFRPRDEEMQETGRRNWNRSTRCYTRVEMYARKLAAEMTIGAARRPVPLDWLDSFCMRNFTGSAEFDDTLPRADGMLEAGLSVDPARLAAAMSEWFTKRGKGNGAAVTVELREQAGKV